MPMLMSILAALALMGILGGAVAPSLIAKIEESKVVASINREEALIEQVRRYWGAEGVPPADMAELISKGYWQAGDNDNGFGGEYSFAVNTTTGVVTLQTTIADADVRDRYASNYRRIWQPVHVGSGVMQISAAMPLATLLGGGGGGGGGGESGTPIHVGTTPPTATSDTLWYDTSSGSAVLKVSNGSGWVETAQPTSGGGGGGSSVPPPGSSGGGVLPPSGPLSGLDGSIYYTTNESGQIVSHIWYNGQWHLHGTGGSVSGADKASTAEVTTASGEFTAVNGATKSTTYMSNTITVNVGSTPIRVAVSSNAQNALCSFNGAAWTNCGRYISGQFTVQVRHESAPTKLTNTSTVLVFDELIRIFSVVTEDDSEPGIEVDASKKLILAAGGGGGAFKLKDGVLYGVGDFGPYLRHLNGGSSATTEWVVVPTPGHVTRFSTAKITGGVWSSLFVVTDAGDVYGTGANSQGQLAQGDTASRTSWNKLKTDASTEFSGAIDVAVNSINSVVVLKSDGTVWSSLVGSTRYNYLNRVQVNEGSGFIGSRDIAVMDCDTQTGESSISLKTTNTCALLSSNGRVYINSPGSNHFSLAYYPDSNRGFAKAIAAGGGGYGAYVIDDTGRAWLAGTGSYYLYYPGDGSWHTLSSSGYSSLSITSHLSNFSGFKKISCSDNVSCLALSNDGRIYALGRYYSQYVFGGSISTDHLTWTPVLNSFGQHETGIDVFIGNGPVSAIVRSNGTIDVAGNVPLNGYLGFTPSATPAQYHQFMLNPNNL